jgi:hypothetical protein
LGTCGGAVLGGRRWWWWGAEAEVVGIVGVAVNT